MFIESKETSTDWDKEHVTDVGKYLKNTQKARVEE